MSLTAEHRAPCDSWLARRDPRWRLGAFVVAILCVASVRQVLPALAGFGFAIALAALGRVPAAWFRVRVGVFLLGLIPFLFVVPFVVNRGAVLWEWSFLQMTDEGLWAALAIGAKTLAIATFGFTLLATAPVHASLAAAGHLGVPKAFVQVAALTYRYAFMLLDELNRLRVALRVRGFRNAATGHAYRTVGQVAGTLVVRGHDRAERVVHAMRCRGFDGRFRTLAVFRMTARDVLFFGIVASIAGGLVAWDRL